mmetsp:Transcript_5300/g.10212  ORF Transcript_5300/g.10212 Transcript_5300/m.10212 type:complete len:282 (+) Transcript_5300:813-1658(+)
MIRTDRQCFPSEVRICAPCFPKNGLIQMSQTGSCQSILFLFDWSHISSCCVLLQRHCISVALQGMAVQYYYGIGYPSTYQSHISHHGGNSSRLGFIFVPYLHHEYGSPMKRITASWRDTSITLCRLYSKVLYLLVNWCHGWSRRMRFWLVLGLMMVMAKVMLVLDLRRGQRLSQQIVFAFRFCLGFVLEKLGQDRSSVLVVFVLFLLVVGDRGSLLCGASTSSPASSATSSSMFRHGFGLAVVLFLFAFLFFLASRRLFRRLCLLSRHGMCIWDALLSLSL